MFYANLRHEMDFLVAQRFQGYMEDSFSLKDSQHPTAR